MTDDFFTISQLTEHIGATRETVRSQTVQRGCPHVVLGSETFFTRQSFVDWLRSREVVQPSRHANVDIYAMPN